MKPRGLFSVLALRGGAGGVMRRDPTQTFLTSLQYGTEAFKGVWGPQLDPHYAKIHSPLGQTIDGYDMNPLTMVAPANFAKTPANSVKEASVHTILC